MIYQAEERVTRVSVEEFSKRVEDMISRVEEGESLEVTSDGRIICVVRPPAKGPLAPPPSGRSRATALERAREGLNVAGPTTTV